MSKLQRAALSCIYNDAGVAEAIPDKREVRGFMRLDSYDIGALSASITVGAVAQAIDVTVDDLIAAILFERNFGTRPACRSFVQRYREKNNG